MLDDSSRIITIEFGREPPYTMKGQGANHFQEGEAMKIYRRLILISLIFGAFTAVGCVKNPVTGKKEFIAIPREQEIAIGQEAAPEFEKEFDDKVPNARLQKYVQKVGRQLAGVSDRPMPYEFALLASETPNAFALPGGKIYVTAGLMGQMTNERQLAAVLGHEVTHVAAKHNVKGLQRQMGAAIFADVVGAIISGESSQEAEAIAKLVGGMANLHYSREDESQADAVGVKYMVRAGYNPWGMVELLELLQSLSNAERALFGDFFASHPLTSKRIEEVRKIVQSDYAEFSPETLDPHTKQFMEMRSLLSTALKE